VIPVVVGYVKLLGQAATAAAVHPPHWLVELVDDDGDGAEAGESDQRVVGAVGAGSGW
jgi:hypothetical protein